MMTAGRHALIVLAALAVPGAANAQNGKVNTLDQMWERLTSCWRPPDLPHDDPGMQITVRFSLKRNGELIGEPRITYETDHVPEDRKQAFRMAVGETLQRCTPMPFTDGMGNAVAGRPLTFRFDARRMKSI